MFSLIITIVSIALVVALVAATMYHGGDTLTQGRTSADAAAFVAGAQQVAGAQVMNMSLTSVEAVDVAALITAKALASAPVVKGTALTLDITNNLVTSVVASAEVCAKINETSGLNAAATADLVDTDTALVITATDVAGKSYGCLPSSKAFSFKY